MTQVTAKIKCCAKNPMGSHNTADVGLIFQPDYADGRNKEWASATPALNVALTVRADVAEHFQVGAPYILTFIPESESREG